MGGDMKGKVEFIHCAVSRTKNQIPIPGMYLDLWAGDNEPKIKAVLVEASRDAKDRKSYSLKLSTSDPRMIALDNRCEHVTADNCQHGPDVCTKCNIVVATEKNICRI